MWAVNLMLVFNSVALSQVKRVVAPRTTFGPQATTEHVQVVHGKMTSTLAQSDSVH